MRARCRACRCFAGTPAVLRQRRAFQGTRSRRGGLFGDQVKWVVVAAEPVTSVDVTAADSLVELDEALRDRGVKLCFAELKDPVKDKLKRFGIYDRLAMSSFSQPSAPLSTRIRRRTTRIERPSLRAFAEADKLEGEKIGREMSKEKRTIFRVEESFPFCRLTVAFGSLRRRWPVLPQLATRRRAAKPLPRQEP